MRLLLLRLLLVRLLLVRLLLVRLLLVRLLLVPRCCGLLLVRLRFRLGCGSTTSTAALLLLADEAALPTYSASMYWVVVDFDFDLDRIVDGLKMGRCF